MLTVFLCCLLGCGIGAILWLATLFVMRSAGYSISGPSSLAAEAVEVVFVAASFAIALTASQELRLAAWQQFVLFGFAFLLGERIAKAVVSRSGKA